MKLSLIVLATGPNQGKVLPILTPQFLIGRDPGCHLRPSSPMISKKHCALIVKEERVFIKDFGSTNGSYVNEVKVEGHRELKHGDKLKIGPLLFEVALETSSGVSKPQTASGSKPATASINKAVAASGTGKPATPGTKPAAPKPAAAAVESDDDLAALLLSGGDETVPDGPSAQIDQGTTIFEMPAQKGLGDSSSDGKPVEPAKPAAPPPTNSEKAASILEMMRKRPRTPNP